MHLPWRGLQGQFRFWMLRMATIWWEQQVFPERYQDSVSWTLKRQWIARECAPLQLAISMETAFWTWLSEALALTPWMVFFGMGIAPLLPDRRPRLAWEVLLQWETSTEMESSMWPCWEEEEEESPYSWAMVRAAFLTRSQADLFPVTRLAVQWATSMGTVSSTWSSLPPNKGL